MFNIFDNLFGVPWSNYWLDLVYGTLGTIKYTVAGFVGATLLGILVAVLRIWGGWVLNTLGRTITEVGKNLPLVTQIFIVYFGLTSIGITLSAFVAGTMALILHHGAYLAEIFRSGILSVDSGQREAGTTLGMSNFSIFRKILLPQAVLVAFPGTGTMLVDLLKSTSLMITIGGAELMTKGQVITSATFRALEVYLVIGAIYFVMCFPLSLLMAYLEQRLAAGKPFSLHRKRLLDAARREHDSYRASTAPHA